MSLEYVQAVFELSPASGNELVIMLACAMRADFDGHFSPGLNYLQTHARCEKRTVQRILKNLTTAEEIRMVKKGDGAGHKTVFRFGKKYCAAVVEIRRLWQEKRVTPTTPFSNEKRVTPTTPFSDKKGDILCSTHINIINTKKEKENGVGLTNDFQAKNLPKSQPDFLQLFPALAEFLTENFPNLPPDNYTNFFNYHSDRETTFKGAADLQTKFKGWSRRAAKLYEEKSNGKNIKPVGSTARKSTVQKLREQAELHGPAGDSRADFESWFNGESAKNPAVKGLTG